MQVLSVWKVQIRSVTILRAFAVVSHHFDLVDPSSLHPSLLSTLGALFSLHPQALAEKILECHLDSDSTSGPYFSPEIAEAIYQLSKDPIMLKIMEEHWTDLNLLNSAG
jgi:hypothetical protein